MAGGKLEEIWSTLLFDATPEERLKMARFMGRFAFVVVAGWAFGLLSPIGLDGFAKADEVDEKIKAAVEPLNRDLGAIKIQLDEGAKVQRKILVAQLSAQLRDLNRIMCTSSDHTVQERMERDIEEVQQDFKALTGERYPLTRCKEL